MVSFRPLRIGLFPFKWPKSLINGAYRAYQTLTNWDDPPSMVVDLFKVLKYSNIFQQCFKCQDTHETIRFFLWARLVKTVLKQLWLDLCAIHDAQTISLNILVRSPQKNWDSKNKCHNACMSHVCLQGDFPPVTARGKWILRRIRKTNNVLMLTAWEKDHPSQNHFLLFSFSQCWTRTSTFFRWNQHRAFKPTKV